MNTPHMKHRAIASLPPYVGPAWRTPSGFTPSGTAADVVRYEREEIGNELPVSAGIMRELDCLPARSIVWVARDLETAAEYYDGNEVGRHYFNGNPHVLFEIPDGVLVVVL